MDLIFRYIPADGILYRYDPRLKLSSLILLNILIVKSSLTGTTVSVLMLLLLFLTAGPPLRIALSLIGALLRFLAVIALAYAGAVGLSGSDPAPALRLLLRLAAFMLIGFLYATSTSPPEIRGTFYALGSLIPRFPASGFALMVSVVISSIPLFFSALHQSREALAGRGGIPWYRPLRRLRCLTIPLLTRLFRRSDLLSDALLARGYHSRRSFSLGPIDRGQLILSLFCYGALVFFMYAPRHLGYTLP